MSFRFFFVSRYYVYLVARRFYHVQTIYSTTYRSKSSKIIIIIIMKISKVDEGFLRGKWKLKILLLLFLFFYIFVFLCFVFDLSAIDSFDIHTPDIGHRTHQRLLWSLTHSHPSAVVDILLYLFVGEEKKKKTFIQD